MVPQISTEARNISEGILVSFPVALPEEILETPNEMDSRGSTNSIIELNETLTHQHQIPGQY